MPATPEQLAGAILGGERAAATHRLNADTAYGPLVPLIRHYRTAGWSYGRIAKELNARGMKTRLRRKWAHVQVRAVCLRFGIT